MVPDGHDLTILVVLSLLAILGIFGHLNILYATYKIKELRTKYGLLLAQLSFSHLVCIVGEVANTSFVVFQFDTSRSRCFHLISFYMSFEVVQAIVMLLVSIDLLLAIVAPVIYRYLSIRHYVLATITFCMSVAVSYALLLYGMLDGQSRGICNLSELNSQTVASIQNIVHIGLGLAQLICYCTSYGIMSVRAHIFMKQNPNACYRNKHRKTMRTISVLIAVYLSTWFLAILLDQVNIHTRASGWSHRLTLYTNLLVMLSFCHIFYVSLWRSSEYRKAFRHIWGGGLSSSVRLVKCFPTNCDRLKRSNTISFIGVSHPQHT